MLGVSHKKLSGWYLQLAQQLGVGASLIEALGTTSGVPSRDRMDLADALSRGESLPEVLERAPAWWPNEDRIILSVASKSGRMVESLYLLSRKHQELARQAGHAVAASVYPMFILHFAVFILPLPELIMGSAEAYFRQVLSVIIPLWAGIGLVVIGAKRRASWLGWIAGLVPGLRGYRKARALSDLCFTLEGLIAAGETVPRAWELAGASAGTNTLRRCARRVAGHARKGRPPGEALQREKTLPRDFVALYTVGEKSGRLEENLRGLATNYQEKAHSSLATVAFWYPKALFIVIAAWLAVRIITFYSELYEEMDPHLF